MKNFNAFLQYCSCPKILMHFIIFPKILMHLQYLCIFQYCTTTLYSMLFLIFNKVVIFQVFEYWWPMSMWTVKRKIWRIEFVRYKCSSIWSSLNMSSLTSISCQQLHVNIEKGDYWKCAMMYWEKWFGMIFFTWSRKAKSLHRELAKNSRNRSACVS